MSRIAAMFLAAAFLCACGAASSPAGKNGATGPDKVVTVAAARETPPSADDDANDVALWIHPEDPARSMLLVAAGTAGLESYGLDGKLIARYGNAEVDHIKVAYGFALQGAARALIVGYDRASGGLLSFTIDPATRQISPAFQQPLATNTEIVGLCLYRSALTATYYAFASGDDGLMQQWQLFERDGKVDGRLVRTIPVGVGSGYCAVDSAAGEVYVSEESVGVWKFAAEPETDATRTGVTFVKPLGPIEEEVKGLGIYKLSENEGYLIASDAEAARFNVHSLRDASWLGSFTLGAAQGVDAVDEAEGIAIAETPLSAAWAHGLFAVVDQANEGGANVKLVSWDTIAAALQLDSAKGSADPRVPPPARAKTVTASVETEPVRNYGDAADDPAIWVHPRDPARSLILGTNKKRGLEVYDLSGKRVQTLDDGRLNNIDLRYDFALAGRQVAIAVATNRTSKSLSVYAVDSDGRVRNVTDGTIATGLGDPYGLCMYRSAKSGDYFVFANDPDQGAFRQWRLVARNGKVGAQVVRDFTVGSQAEGCAADDETGQLYIAEEDVGLWRYGAEPDDGTERVQIDKVGNGGLVDDVEGVAIWRGTAGRGYLVVSSQGSDSYAVYRREGDNRFVGTFHVVANDQLGIDGVSETDGLDVTSATLGPHFPHGLFVAQDGRNITPALRQNFKLVPWERIAEALSLPADGPAP